MAEQERSPELQALEEKYRKLIPQLHIQDHEPGSVSVPIVSVGAYVVRDTDVLGFRADAVGFWHPALKVVRDGESPVAYGAPEDREALQCLAEFLNGLPAHIEPARIVKMIQDAKPHRPRQR